MTAGVLAVGAVSSVGSSAATGARSAAAPSGDVVATGYLPAQFDVDDVQVELVPTITPSTAPGPLPSYYVGSDQISLGSDHLLSIALAPIEVPDAFRSAEGRVTVLVEASDGKEVWSTTLSAQTVATAGSASHWVDPADLQAVASLPVTSTRNARHTTIVSSTAKAERRIAALPAARFASPADADYTEDAPPTSDPTWATSDDDRAGWDGGAAEPRVIPGCPDGGTGPHETEYLDNVRIWATIGTSYPAGDSTAHMKVASNESNGSTFGSGVKYSGISASASGSGWADGGWEFTWRPSGRAKSYRKEVEYARVKYSRYLAGPACDHVHWVPVQETGGTASNTQGVNRPDWHSYDNCAQVDRGTWGRNLDRGHKYDYDASVKAADLLGVNLGISRSYSRSQAVYCDVVGRGHWMCGNNDTPSLAGKVEEWRTAPPDAP